MTKNINFPCVIYGIEPDNRSHIMTVLSNIGKSHNIDYREISEYSELLAHGYGFWGNKGFSEEDLKDCLAKRKKNDYCKNRYAEYKNIRSNTDLFYPTMAHAQCLVCEFANTGNEERLKNEIFVLQGLLSHAICVSDLKSFGKPEKIFISWANICGQRTGLTPIVRFTYHMYNTLEYGMIDVSQMDITALSLLFNSSFADEYVKMSSVLNISEDEIAELFYGYIITWFQEYKTPSREEVLSVLDMLSGRKKKPAPAAPAAPAVTDNSSIPEELYASMYKNLGYPSGIGEQPSDSGKETLLQKADPFSGDIPDIEPEHAVNDIPVSDSSIKDSEKNSPSTVPSAGNVTSVKVEDASHSAAHEHLKNLSDNKETGEEKPSPVENADIDISDSSSEIEKQPCDTDRLDGYQSAECDIDDPVSEPDNGTYNDFFDFQNPKKELRSGEQSLSDAQDISSEKSSKKPASDASGNVDNTLKTEEIPYALFEKTFRIIPRNFPLTVLNEFNCQQLTLHSFMEFCVAEIGIYNGICGILLYLPGIKKYYFAAYWSVICGVIKNLFNSDVTIITTNLPLLLAFLERYHVSAGGKICPLDIYGFIYFCSQKKKESFIHCKNLLPLCRKYGILNYKKEPENITDIVFFYTEMYEFFCLNMSKKLFNQVYIWTNFERMAAHSFDENSINYPHALFEKTQTTRYVFCPSGDSLSEKQKIVRIKNLSHEGSLYEFFCLCCAYIYAGRLDRTYGIRIHNITASQLSLSYSTDCVSDLTDALWQIMLSLYKKLFHRDVPELSLVF